MTGRDAENHLRSLLNSHGDGHPISDAEHADARLALYQMTLIAAEQAREATAAAKRLETQLADALAAASVRHSEGMAEIKKGIDGLSARIPDAELHKDMRQFFEGRRAWSFVGQSLKSAAIWLTAIAAGVLIFKQAGAEVIRWMMEPKQ